MSKKEDDGNSPFTFYIRLPSRYLLYSIRLTPKSRRDLIVGTDPKTINLRNALPTSAVQMRANSGHSIVTIYTINFLIVSNGDILPACRLDGSEREQLDKLARESLWQRDSYGNCAPLCLAIRSDLC